MNPEKSINENEKIELEEQAIGEPLNVVEQEPSRPYKPTHEMSNEEIDEIAPVEGETWREPDFEPELYYGTEYIPEPPGTGTDSRDAIGRAEVAVAVQVRPGDHDGNRAEAERRRGIGLQGAVALQEEFN